MDVSDWLDDQADKLVRAYQSHDALIAALRDLLHDVQGAGFTADMAANIGGSIAVASAALAAAESGGGAAA